MRQFHDGLSGADDLPRLRQCFDHGSIGVGDQRRIIALVLCDFKLRLSGRQQGAGAIGRRLGLIVSRLRHGARGDQPPIARLIRRRLDHARPGRRDIADLRRDRVIIFGAVDPHERLAGLDGLAGIDQPLGDFARYPKTQIALDAGRNDTRESARRGLGGLDRGDPDQLGSGSRIAGWAGRGFGRCAGGEADRGERYECRETRWT